MTSVGLRARARSCLLAGALGDAWGGPYEGLTGPVRPSFPDAPRLSDDTWLTLATCEAIVLNRGRVQPERIAERFRRWFEESRITGAGSATLKALRDLAAGAHWALAGARGEFAAGAGAAMRAAPLSFFLDPNIEADRRTIRDISRITHHSDEAYSGALAVIVALRLCATASVVPQDLLSAVANALPDTAVRDRLLDLSAFRESPGDAALRFGCSGHGVEAVPIALFVAATTAREPLESVIATAVSLGGDTDTIAAIAAQVAAISGRPVPEGLIARLPEAPQLAPVLDPFISLLQ
ncbi:ADP-ribosylglycohydrolase family protein [Sorangium sp. So ce590]|uniref:ADP-ribosylglycohydrolase family protein n=1 Tax=Sorangium sp. So ce590 TaxID=3133317 RepID=UPI003F61805A